MIQADHTPELVLFPARATVKQVGYVVSPMLWAQVCSPAPGIAHLVYYQDCGQQNKLGLQIPNYLSQTLVSLC